MDSNYKDYVLKELDNLVSQIVEASEFNASESYRGLVGSLERQIDYHQECIDKCKQMLLLMNARKPNLAKWYHHIGVMMSQRKQELRLMTFGNQKM